LINPGLLRTFFSADERLLTATSTAPHHTSPANLQTEMPEKEGSAMAGPARAAPRDRHPYSSLLLVFRCRRSSWESDIRCSS